MAYGEFLYAWNAIDGATTGVSITELPYEKVNNMCDSATMEPTPLETETSSDSAAVHEEACYYFQPRPTIVALLLHGERLTVIATEDNTEGLSYYSTASTEEGTQKIISDTTNLTIRVYNISSIPFDDGPLQLLAQSEKVIKGSFITARMSQNTGIIIVSSSIDTTLIEEQLYRSNSLYCGLNSIEYTKLAGETALNQMEPFIELMLEELELDGTCASTVPVRNMLSHLTSTSFLCISFLTFHPSLLYSTAL